MKPKDFTDDSFVEYNKEFNKKGFQDIQIFLLRIIHEIGVKKFLLLQK